MPLNTTTPLNTVPSNTSQGAAPGSAGVSTNNSPPTTPTTPISTGYTRKCKDWLTDYMKLVEDTESPTAYHKWCGMLALGATLRRNVYMKRNYTIYPNQYIILVGPPAVGKGAAINPMREVLKKAGTVNFLNDRWTMESIITKLEQGFSRPLITNNSSGIATGKLQQDHSATIISTELPMFISGSKNMTEFLCEMWDRGEYEYHTKNKGTNTAGELCTSLLGACVPDYIRHINITHQGNIVTGGLASRCIHVYASKPGKINSWPSPMSGSQLETDLVSDLQHIAGLYGEMTWAKEAFTVYDKFYQSCGPLVTGYEQPLMTDYRSRCRTHVVKTAMLLAISQSDSLVIEKQHIEQAIVMINETKEWLIPTYQYAGASKEQEAIINIGNFIEDFGMASYQDIYSSNYQYLQDMTSFRFDMLLETLVRMGFCTTNPTKDKFTHVAGMSFRKGFKIKASNKKP